MHVPARLKIGIHLRARYGTRGAMLIYMSVVLAALMAVTSLAVDWGRVQLTKTELQRAADSAARAAMSQLNFGTTAAQTAAVTFAGDNKADSSKVVIDPTNDIDFGTWDSVGRTFTVLTGSDVSSANAVRVSARRTSARGNATPLVFGQTIGMSTCDETASAVASLGPTEIIDYSSGFTGDTTLALNGSALINGANLQVTTTTANQHGSAWWPHQVTVTKFNTTFTFVLTSATADGFTFTIQNMGTTANGGTGGNLGFQGITHSVGIKFDIYSNSGEGTDSTGVFLNGASPYNVGSIDMTSSTVVLKSGHVMTAALSYDGTTLTETVTDTTTLASFTHAYTVDIPTTVGSSRAYVGFTGGTGGSTAIQNIQNWYYTAPGGITLVK